ncbi:hypothetical protein ACRFS9_000733 [Escherichia coli]
MAHSITVRLNKPAREFQAGENIGFNIRAGVQYYDRQTKKKEWTNYSAVVFAKPGAQADYYRSVLVEGGIVEITGENIRVDVYQGQNGQSITLELLNAKIGFAASRNKRFIRQGCKARSSIQRHPQRMGFTRCSVEV